MEDTHLNKNEQENFKNHEYFLQKFAPNLTLLNYLMFSKIENVILFMDVFWDYLLVNKQGIFNNITSHISK